LLVGLATASAQGQFLSRVYVAQQQIEAGSGDTKIKVLGDSFTSSMRVAWNGQPRATQFVNDFVLKATITQADLATPGLGQITVIDTSSGQTVSDPIPILVYLALASNDLIYDSVRDKIYVSVSKQDPSGPALAIVDPERGMVERYIPLPSDPGPLAVTADAKFLFLGMEDRIRRIDLTGSSPDADIPASAFFANNPRFPTGTPLLPTSLLALPGQDTSLVVLGGVGAQVVDGTTVRPDHANESGRCLIASPDGVTIFSGPGFFETTISDSGFPPVPNYQNNALDAGPTCPVYAGGLIYGSDGDVVDATSHSRVRWLPALGNIDVVPESQEVHFLDRQGGSDGNPWLVYKAFDTLSGSLLKSIPLGIQMSVANDGAPNGHLIHWGTNGIAFGDYSTLNSNVAKWLYVIRVP
jgi:hypothetical protein